MGETSNSIKGDELSRIGGLLSEIRGRVLKSRKLTPKFIGPYQITRRIGPVAYEIALPPYLANLHNVFHVSQLRKYMADPSHVLEVDDIQVWKDLTIEAGPIRILDF